MYRFVGKDPLDLPLPRLGFHHALALCPDRQRHQSLCRADETGHERRALQSAAQAALISFRNDLAGDGGESLSSPSPSISGNRHGLHPKDNNRTNAHASPRILFFRIATLVEMPFPAQKKYRTSFPALREAGTLRRSAHRTASSAPMPAGLSAAWRGIFRHPVFSFRETPTLPNRPRRKDGSRFSPESTPFPLFFPKEKSRNFPESRILAEEKGCQVFFKNFF